MAPQSFVPGLIIVDFQEDFCPPTGSLAVNGGRDIAPVINKLLNLPGFAIRVATKDYHPRNHISFVSNHPPPNNKPYESKVTIVNPENPEEKEESVLWPDHCVHGSKGAELVPELEADKVDLVIEKGVDARLEMYSGFAAPFKNPEVGNSGLAEKLRQKGVTHVYVVGLAFDYCVKCTAIDAAKEGFEVYVVEEGCRSVDSGKEAHGALKKTLEENGVKIVKESGAEVERVRYLA